MAGGSWDADVRRYRILMCSYHIMEYCCTRHIIIAAVCYTWYAGTPVTRAYLRATSTTAEWYRSSFCAGRFSVMPFGRDISVPKDFAGDREWKSCVGTADAVHIFEAGLTRTAHVLTLRVYLHLQQGPILPVLPLENSRVSRPHAPPFRRFVCCRFYVRPIPLQWL